MSEHFHIIIAGDEGSPKSFKISKKCILASAFTIFVVSSVLLSSSLFTTGLYTHNKLLVKQAASAKERTRNALAVTTDLQMRLQQDKLAAQDKIDSLTEKHEQEIARLEEERKRITTKHKNLVESLKTNNNLKVAQLEKDQSDKIAELERQYTRQIAELERKNLKQRLAFKEEKELLLSTAVTELNSRSEIIEEVISDIGIKVRKSKKSGTENSGGPFVAADESSYDDLLYRTDSYLKTIKLVPLGSPVKGSVSSWFGKRKDPLNKKHAFHEGIDFRGRKGDPVVATADGKIVFAGHNGGYGKFVKIDHGNGYTTSFAHLHNYHVKKGDYVTRGQVIGLIGNSGRSTGSHLHYEVSYKNKPINPRKYMKVADKTCHFLNIAE